MSRIGKLPIPVPSGVDVTIDGQQISVKGPKGTLAHMIAEPITVERDETACSRSSARTTSAAAARCTASPGRW